MPERSNRFIRCALNYLENKTASRGCKQARKLFCAKAPPVSGVSRRVGSRIVARAVAAEVTRAEVFFAQKSASYSENEIKGNARRHPGPLPQAREKHPQCLGNRMLSGA